MENQHEDLAVVKEIKDGFVFIEMQTSGSCDKCAMHGICQGMDKKLQHKMRTDMELSEGDLIRVQVSASMMVFSSFIIFIFPILSMLLFYGLGKYLFRFSENFSILFSFAGLILSGITIYFIDKKYTEKIIFKIIEKVEK
jgi:positive regulator of sigma E activity